MRRRCLVCKRFKESYEQECCNYDYYEKARYKEADEHG
jgi:hypothetical protein